MACWPVNRDEGRGDDAERSGGAMKGAGGGGGATEAGGQ